MFEALNKEGAKWFHGQRKVNATLRKLVRADCGERAAGARHRNSRSAAKLSATLMGAQPSTGWIWADLCCNQRRVGVELALE